MKPILASSLATLLTATLLAAAPATAEPVRKTELVALDGSHVERMQLRYDFNSAWVVDGLSILYRDDSRDYYLVTLKKECTQVLHRGRGFDFYPSDPWQLLENRSYEVRPKVGPRCDVARIEQISDDRATTLRETADRRYW